MQGNPEGTNRSLIIGGTGLVGGYIVERLKDRGERPLVLSRRDRTAPGIDWIRGDLTDPSSLRLPSFTMLYCTADAALVAPALPHLLNPSLRRVIAFSSTSVMTKVDSEVARERKSTRDLADAEEQIKAACGRQNVGWTILRPTLIYAEGRDINITPLSHLIRRFGFMPLVGDASGLRQPVHAEDLAIGAIAAAESPLTINKLYLLPGLETITYREMIGRIFDGLGRPRRMISLPPALWRVLFMLAKPLFPAANVAWGLRMMKDMTFDPGPAIRDFGWSPRAFHPDFKARSVNP
jgi:nucleoside-diphosphate-sugar epimerase